MELTGKVSLVTGGAHRLGRAIAVALAEHGSHIGIHFHTSEAEARVAAQEIRKGGVQAQVFAADLSRSSEATQLVDSVLAAFGRIDVLVNNAAVYFPTPLGEVTEEEWDTLLNLNLRGAFFCSQAAGLAMKRQGSGKIVNIADVAGLSPWPSYLPYSISKAGVIAMTHGLAKALAPEVTVNAVAPGTVLLQGDESAAEVRRFEELSLLKRIGAPKEVVSAVLYLVEAADFVTGIVLPVDGGRHLL